MEDDRTDLHAHSNGPPAADGDSPTPSTDHLRRREYELRARCAQLRHWCRQLFPLDGTDGVLPADVARELRETEPEMSLDDAQAAIRLVALKEPLPASTGTGSRASALAAERERLRTAFFTMYDAAFPDDRMTDADFTRLIAQGPCVSMEDALAEIERELEAGH